MSFGRESPIEMTTSPPAPRFPTHEAHIESGNSVFRYYVEETASGISDDRTRTGDLVFSVTESKDLIYFEYPDHSYHCFRLRTDVRFQDLDLKDVYDTWRKLLHLFDRVLQTASRNILRKDGDIPRALLRSLMEIADVVTHTEGVYAEFYRMFQAPDSTTGHQNPDPGSADVLRRDFDEVKRNEKELSATIDTLIFRASNIMSIDEAYKAREQGASIKRLTWITFIFLPLLFVSSLFGMNIDLLKDNPAWWTYLYFCAPMAALIFLAFLGLKHKSILRTYVAKHWKRLGDRLSRRRPRHPQSDLESQPLVAKSPSIDNYFHAAGHGHTTMVNSFLFFGNIQITAADPINKRTALHFAAEGGHHATVRMLVSEFGADTEAKEEDGWTALQLAAQNGHEATVRALVTDLGADIEAKINYDRNALHLAADNGHEATVRALVTDLGADIEGKCDHGRTALHLAAIGGHEATVRALVTDLGADIKVQDLFDRTALHLAAQNGHEATVRALVMDLGADITAQDLYCWTALHLAAKNGHEATVRALVKDLGADIKAKDFWSRTALHLAADNGHAATVRALGDLGADKEATL